MTPFYKVKMALSNEIWLEQIKTMDLPNLKACLKSQSEVENYELCQKIKEQIDKLESNPK